MKIVAQFNSKRLNEGWTKVEHWANTNLKLLIRKKIIGRLVSQKCCLFSGIRQTSFFNYLLFLPGAMPRASLFLPKFFKSSILTLLPMIETEVSSSYKSFLYLIRFVPFWKRTYTIFTMYCRASPNFFRFQTSSHWNSGHPFLEYGI